MTSVRELLIAEGIKLASYAEGDRKGLCPKCSHTRRKKAEPCLSVTIEAEQAVWCCHNHGCGFEGSVHERRREDHRRYEPRQVKESPVKPAHEPQGLPENVIQWFANRGIGLPTLARNGIGHEEHFMPGTGKEVACITFPFKRDGQVVNIKYRDGAKNFAQVKGAEKILFGLDDIAGREIMVVVEGEIDKLSFEEAGITNVVSVPDGAPQRSASGQEIPTTMPSFPSCPIARPNWRTSPSSSWLSTATPPAAPSRRSWPDGWAVSAAGEWPGRMATMPR